VIAGFSFVGIMLGVATLIIVMAVMNGFRGELLDKVLGYNGHATSIRRWASRFPTSTATSRRCSMYRAWSGPCRSSRPR
jgi:ABC-type lipoprotein release transport system permease subunit